MTQKIQPDFTHSTVKRAPQEREAQSFEHTKATYADWLTSAKQADSDHFEFR